MFSAGRKKRVCLSIAFGTLLAACSLSRCCFHALNSAHSINDASISTPLPPSCGVSDVVARPGRTVLSNDVDSSVYSFSEVDKAELVMDSIEGERGEEDMEVGGRRKYVSASFGRVCSVASVYAGPQKHPSKRVIQRSSRRIWEFSIVTANVHTTDNKVVSNKWWYQ